MKIDPKATKADLLKIIDDLRDEAIGWHQNAKSLEDDITELRAELSRRIDAMGDNKPWKLASLAFVAGGLLVATVMVVL